MKNIFFYLLLPVLLWGCSNEDAPLPDPGPARPTMNKQDSLAIVAFYHSMKCAEWKYPYHWDIEDYVTWGGIEVALDVAKNEYRVIRVIVSIPQLFAGRLFSSSGVRQFDHAAVIAHLRR